MSEADKLFKELGYKKENRNNAEVFYKNTKYLSRQIGFNQLTKSVMIDTHYITMQELKAINKKCEELGWLE